MHDESLETFEARQAKSSTGQIGMSLGVALQYELGGNRPLMPTPNTMDGLPPRSPDQIAEAKLRTPAGYSNLRETVVNGLSTNTDNEGL